MSKIAELAFFLILILMTSCSQNFKNYTFYKDKDSRFEAFDIEGAIGVIAETPDGNDYFAYKDGFGIQLQSKLSTPEKPSHENTDMYPNGYTFIPEPLDYKLQGPQLKSPDGTKTVVSCVQNKEGSTGADIFLIFDNNSNKFIFSQTSYQNQAIRGIAWSPNSSKFVILSSYHYHSLNINIFANISGHPVGSSDFYLSFYTREGQLLFTKKIISGIKNSSAKILWLEKYH